MHVRVRLIMMMAAATALGGGWIHFFTGGKHGSRNFAPSVAAASSALIDPAGRPVPAPSEQVIPPAGTAIHQPAASVFGSNYRLVTLDDVPAGPFRDSLGKLSDVPRRAALATLGKLHVPLNDVGSLGVNQRGRLYYRCVRPEATSPPAVAAFAERVGVEISAGTTSAAAGVMADLIPPVRHSRPGSANVIFLDFNGRTITGTSWNDDFGVDSYAAKPYDIDGDVSGFSADERDVIIRIWERVAEDYSGFDVDVTTEEPVGFSATTGSVLITSGLDFNGELLPHSANAAGVAYLDVFGNADYVAGYSPAFVYARPYDSEAFIAEVASHEMGHNLSLSHDGTSTSEYYGGHGSGETSWGPIMGANFGRSITQWSKGEYRDANNPQDDLARLAAHLGPVPADHAGGNQAAVRLTGDGADFFGLGVIVQSGEADCFSFGTTGGTVVFTASPFRSAMGTNGGNLDVALELRDSANAVLAASNRSENFTATALVATVPAGTYFVWVTGVGTGSPLANPPDGYTNYGSLGQYRITGTIMESSTFAPFFVNSPAHQIVNAGDGAAFCAYASGIPAPAYQWQRLRMGEDVWADLSDDGIFAGTTTAFLSLGIARYAMSGDQIRCVATNTNGSVSSDSAVLTVNAAFGVAPTIANLPSTFTVNYGDYFFLGATITGSSPMTYCWKKDGVDLPNGSYRFYFKDAATPADNGFYTLTAENSMGVVTSSIVTVTVGGATRPTISSLPSGASLSFGDFLNVSPIVTGTNPVTYQWSKDGTILLGATNRSFAKNDVTPADSGHYTLSATNPIGTVTSTAVVVTVSAAVVNELRLPAEIAVGYGETLDIYPQVAGTKPTAFQWKKDGLPLSEASNRNFFKGNVTLADSGRYTLTATNPVGTVTSAPVTVTVRPAIAPLITQHPVSLDVGLGLIANFSVAAAGTNPLGFQWQFNGRALAGATASTLTIANVSESDLGRYTAVVTNPGGVATSEGAILSRAPLRGVATVEAGGAHNLFIQSGGALWVMGRNDFGQLGDGTTTARRNPVKVSEGVAVAVAGENHSLFIKADSSLWATGNNEFGQLGDGTTVNRANPVAVATDVVTVSAGFAHSLFLKSDGTLWGMGQNSSGQLGDGSKTDRSKPVLIATAVVAVAAGTAHTLFLKEDGSLWATGSDSDGQLGDGRTVSRTSPIQVAAEVRAIAAGAAHSLFLKTNGSLWAAGYNYSGQLGDGTTVSRRNPVQISTGVASIAGGWSHSVFVKADGTLWATGANGFGQLGDGSTDRRIVPVQIATEVAAATAGPFQSLFLKTDGSMWVVGLNKDGQLGDGSVVNRSNPVRIADGPLLVPAAPTGVSARENILAPGFRVSWQPTIDAAHYEVWRGLTSDFSAATRIAGAVPIAFHHDFDAALGTHYYYWITAINLAGRTGPPGGAATAYSAVPPPVVLNQPESCLVTAGTPVHFTVAASSLVPLTYQWQKDGLVLSGATAPSYAISAARVVDTGSYAVVLSNGAATVTSAAAILTVGTVPAGFDVQHYLALNPVVAPEFAGNPFGAWLYYRDHGIYDGEIHDDYFRVDEYLVLYPELYAAFGSDLGAALEHWLSVGSQEGRLGRIPVEFSASGYFERNPDVATAVHHDPMLGWGHYWTYGIYGGRRFDDEFRVFEYLALNPDLQAAFLHDWRGATLHWLRYGRTEGRLGRVPVIFNVDDYLARYPEVGASWGTYPTTVWLHYWLYGIDEGRIFDSEFRVDEYMAMNSDVVAIIGNDRRKAFMHWVRYGRTEGRSGRYQ